MSKLPDRILGTITKVTDYSALSKCHLKLEKLSNLSEDTSHCHVMVSLPSQPISTFHTTKLRQDPRIKVTEFEISITNLHVKT